MWFVLGFLFLLVWKCGRLLFWFDCRVGVGWSNECVFGFKVVFLNLLFKIVLFELVLDFLLKEGISFGCDWRLVFLLFLIVIFIDNGWRDILLEFVFVFVFWFCKGGFVGIFGWLIIKVGFFCGLLFIFVIVVGEGFCWMGCVVL